MGIRTGKEGTPKCSLSGMVLGLRVTGKLGGRCPPEEEAAGDGVVWQPQLPVVAAPGNLAMLLLAKAQLELCVAACSQGQRLS